MKMLLQAKMQGVLFEALKEVAKAKLASSPSAEVCALMHNEACVGMFALTLKTMLEKSTDWTPLVQKLVDADLAPIKDFYGNIIGLAGM